jgi:hypothetical protein
MASNGDREISSATAATPSFKNAEYEALRQEILTRNEFRQRTVELTLLSSGAILAAGLKIEDLGPLLLLYPLAVFFLAASWAHNGVGVLLAGSHIREQFERSSDDNGWESAWRSHPLARPFSILAVLSSSGVFLTVQLLTWGLGLTQFQYRPGDWVLAAAGGAAIVATFVLMRYYARLQQSPGRT